MPEDFVVAVDTANGATSVVAEKVFSALGIKHYILNILQQEQILTIIAAQHILIH